MPTFNTLASDSFNRANENPLNSTNWGAFLQGQGNLQVVSNQAEATSAPSDCSEYYKSVSLPSDQFAQVTVSMLAASSFVYVFVRATVQPSVPAYYFLNLISAGGGFQQSLGIGRNGLFLSFIRPATFSVGDTLLLAAYGGNIEAFRNGVSFSHVTDSTYTSGVSALGVQPNSAVSDVGFTNFATGSVQGTINGSVGFAFGASIYYTGPKTGYAGTIFGFPGGYIYTIDAPNGTYTLTPRVLPGVIFHPASQTVVVSNSNSVDNVNFTPTFPDTTISGNVGGSAFAGALVTCVDQNSQNAQTTLADSFGDYIFATETNRTYLISASFPGYSFQSMSVVTGGFFSIATDINLFPQSLT